MRGVVMALGVLAACGGAADRGARDLCERACDCRPGLPAQNDECFAECVEELAGLRLPEPCVECILEASCTQIPSCADECEESDDEEDFGADD